MYPFHNTENKQPINFLFSTGNNNNQNIGNTFRKKEISVFNNIVGKQLFQNNNNAPNGQLRMGNDNNKLYNNINLIGNISRDNSMEKYNNNNSNKLKEENEKIMDDLFTQQRLEQNKTSRNRGFSSKLRHSGSLAIDNSYGNKNLKMIKESNKL